MIAKYVHSQQLKIKLHIMFDTAEAGIVEVIGSEPLTSEILKDMIVELDKYDFTPNNKLKTLL